MSNIVSLKYKKRPLIIYDDNCQLCCRFKEALEMIDRSHLVQFIPLSDESFFSQVPLVNFEDCEKVVHLITEKNEVLKGDEVVRYLLALIPGVRAFSWLLESTGGQRASKVFYETIEKLKKRKNCSRC
jgi:predicted DCC family thiol-disulfide oxidoreductase YuxK